jgi:hypothetical protein
MLALTRPFQVPPEKGASTAIWLAGDDEAQGLSGQFVVKRQISPCQFRDVEALRRLDVVCERYLKA